MKAIVIKRENAQKLMDVISAEQGKATARIITRYEDLEDICAGIERKLGISKKAMQGVKAHYHFGQQFPSAYKYTPESTHVIVEYRSGHWVLITAYRDTCPNRRTCCDIMLTADAEKAILDAYRTM